MDVREWHDEIVFLHKVKPGAADRSYGIQVAKLAGLPEQVVGAGRARCWRCWRRATRQAGRATAASTSCRCLRQPRRQTAAAASRPIAGRAGSSTRLKPDELTPAAALEALYRLKAAARKAARSRNAS